MNKSHLIAYVAKELHTSRLQAQYLVDTVLGGIRQGLLKSPVKVHLLGGELSIEWPDPEGALTMVGPSTRVFDGRVVLN